MSNQLTMYNNSMNGNIHGNHAQNAIQSQIETPEIGLALDDLNSQNPPANKRPRVQQTLEENERHLMYSKVLTTSVNNIKQSHFSYGGSELQYNENNHGRNNFSGQRDAGSRDGLFDGAIFRNEVIQKKNKGSVLDCVEKVPPLKSRVEVKTGAAAVKNREVYNGHVHDHGPGHDGSRRRVLIVPHNKLDEGVSEVKFWYPWLKSQIHKKANIECQVCDMPDPHLGREVFWIPHLSEDLHVDRHCVLIGHGLGASCALRWAEDNEVAAVVLIDGGYQHHEDAHLKAAYYFDRDWDWDQIRANCPHILAYTSHYPPSQLTPSNQPGGGGVDEHLNSGGETNDDLRDPKCEIQNLDDLLNEQQIAPFEDQQWLCDQLGVNLQYLQGSSFKISLEETLDEVLNFIERSNVEN
ncbi:uncharacterized protein LOC134853696 [Symsagittifera roscoffensis]|uniref:uncharacterized protein LOC134853696 n=1 Tax=Symsagittifera roscoffensis TaxID=84072 RepID=UPI00307BA1DD